jgi:hypothetical protein
MWCFEVGVRPPNTTAGEQPIRTETPMLTAAPVPTAGTQPMTPQTGTERSFACKAQPAANVGTIRND